MTSQSPTTNHTPDNPEIGHEKTDVGLRGVVLFGGALVVGGIIVHLLIWVLFLFFGSLNAGQYPRTYPMAPTGVLRLPPSPRLQEKPREDLKALRKEEDVILSQYGWGDENGGVARIPVDEAMKRVLERGLPAAPPSPDVAAAGRAPTRASSGRFVQEGQQQ